MSPILVTLTSHCDSHLENSNTSFSEIELDGVDLNSNRRDRSVHKQIKSSMVFGRLNAGAPWKGGGANQKEVLI